MAKKRRKKKFYTDPLTGRKKEVGAYYNPITGKKIPKGYYEDPLTGRLVKSKSQYRHKEFSHNYPSEPVRLEDVDPIVWLILGLIIAFFCIYWFVIRPFVSWIRDNTATAIIIGVIILAILLVCLILYVKYRIKKKKEKAEFEKAQIEKGLIKFVDRFGTERWGKPDEVKRWTKENKEAEEKEKLINKVVDEIERFKPLRKYKNEFPYQIELVGYLKSTFPGADIEQQKGSSRPDIIIEDVAIEVKGPTRTQDLQTIADKCMRYYQHFGEIVIVLFEVDVYEPRYDCLLYTSPSPRD